ncbi:hypothetical protein MPTK2_8g00850 [Marchantia polymorpha subsp. ruderalis]
MPMPSTSLRWTCLTLLCISVLHCARAANCTASDSAALLDFKNGFSCQDINNPGLVCQFDTWVPGTDCCNSWSGVTCDATGQVTDISVFGFWNGDLTFQIHQSAPASTFMTQLPRLKALESIDIQFARFGDAELPKVWGQIAKLKHINIVGVAGFTGEIPKEFGNLSNLEVFHWDTMVPTTLGPGLSDSKGIPKELCKLHKLREFYVFLLPNWSGTLPDCIDGWTSIQSITINNGDPDSYGEVLNTGGLTGPLPSNLGKLKTLTYLSLVGNKFTGSIPKSFGSLSNLRTLRLNNNRLSGAIPWKELSQLKFLVTLDLKINNFHGTLPPLTPNCFQNLEYLDASNTSIWGELPRRILDLPMIGTLKFRHVRLWGWIPSATFMNASRADFNFDFSYNFLSGPPPKLPGPTGVFKAPHNKLSTSIPAAYGSLYTLDLSFNRLTGRVPAAVLAVNSLSLDGNNFTNFP